MPIRSTSRNAFALASILALSMGLAGCSSAASPSAGASSAPAAASSAATSAPAAGAALRACDIVSSALIFATLKVTVPDGTADSPDVCKYTADGVTIVVQTSTQASMYYPKSTYGAAANAGSIDLTGGDVSYGFYQPTDGSGKLGNVTVLVVKGEKAVFFTGSVLSPGTTQDVLNLANAIALAF